MLHPVLLHLWPEVYCGPTAIAAVTGLPMAEVLRAAHRYMKRPLRRPIVGMQDVQITGTLALLGFRVEIEQWYNDDGGKPTFTEYVRSMPVNQGPAIVRFTEHVAAITYDEYVCTYTKGMLVPIAQAPKPRSRVHCIMKVEPL